MKLQKIMIDAGFTCPNRDGRVGRGGCTYCLPASFSPRYCQGSIREQIAAGKRFVSGKYTDMKYLVYFQSYSNTYAPIETLRQRYQEALAEEDVVGLVIATRPDCIEEEALAYLTELKQAGWDIRIEIGVESLYDKTLRRINRGHTNAQSIDAIIRCHAAGLPVTLHLIIGLPGETRDEILQEAEMISAFPISGIKLHQLQILRGTAMAREWREHPSDFLDLTADSYAHLAADFLSLLREDIEVERLVSSSPASLLLHPRWGLKPYQMEEMIRRLLHENRVLR